MSDKTRGKVKFIVNCAYVGVIALIIYLIYRAIDIVLPFLLAIILVAILSPIVRFIHRKLHINLKAVSIIMMALLYILAGFLIVVLVSQSIVILQNLFLTMPEYFTNELLPSLQNLYYTIEKWVGDLSPAWSQSIESVAQKAITILGEQITNLSSNGISMISGLIGKLPDFLIALIFTIMLSFFISARYDDVKKFLSKHLPERIREVYPSIISLIKSTIFRYIKAVFILMLITFVELSIGLLFLGVNSSFIKAAGIAMFDALPVFGTGGIMIPWIIIELLQKNYALAGNLTILYVIVTIIRNIIEPKIVSDKLELNPIVSLVSIYAGYKLLGVLGMITFPILTHVLITLYKSNILVKPEDSSNLAAEETDVVENVQS